MASFPTLDEEIITVLNDPKVLIALQCFQGDKCTHLDGIEVKKETQHEILNNPSVLSTLKTLQFQTITHVYFGDTEPLPMSLSPLYIKTEMESPAGECPSSVKHITSKKEFEESLKCNAKGKKKVTPGKVTSPAKRQLDVSPKPCMETKQYVYSVSDYNYLQQLASSKSQAMLSVLQFLTMKRVRKHMKAIWEKIKEMDCIIIDTFDEEDNSFFRIFTGWFPDIASEDESVAHVKMCNKLLSFISTNELNFTQVGENL